MLTTYRLQYEGFFPVEYTPGSILRPYFDHLDSWRVKAARNIHFGMTVPTGQCAKVSSGAGTLGYFFKLPQVKAVGLGGGALASALNFTGEALEFVLDPYSRSTSTFGWLTLKTVTQNGIDYVLKSGPAGEVAWFIAEEGSDLIQLTLEEVKKLGLPDPNEASKLPEVNPSATKTDTKDTNSSNQKEDKAGEKANMTKNKANWKDWWSTYDPAIR